MNNLFNFEYETEQVNNKDNSPSRFSVVFGEGGNVIHAKKDAYQLIGTEAVSNLGGAFIDKGYDVKSFTHRHGEVIGLNINLGQQLSKVGDKSYNAFITIPNNGGGSGFLALKELRLVCTNGMVRTMSNNKGSIKIPHNLSYKYALSLMQESLEKFTHILESVREKDLQMDSILADKYEVTRLLNEWFFNYEMPENHKAGMTKSTFRQLLVEDPDSIKCIDRYKQLKSSLDKELGYNEELGLQSSNYTVYATIANYLTRRGEKSQTSAPTEIMEQRNSVKLEKFESLLLV